ncbi:MAG TPA: serine/threonine-protein kinase [Polyangiaceae bacterium]|nr:serine/threonine-protein kinase [Polyangiaceae bacterium]
MTSGAPEPIVGSAMGKYNLIAELARGGMGNVYLAALSGPAGFSKLLVVKELKPELCFEPEYVAMFLEEARLAARLTHPNIVQLYDVGLEGGRYFIAMEYLDGRSLARVLRCFAREGSFPVGAHLRILGDCLMGLHYAHELRGFDGEDLGIVHRDVSPFNVMVTFDGQVKLLDFGIAKAVDSPSDTRAGVVKGKVAYMAPEQAAGARVDRRADVYSAGVMIWEAAAGRRMWPGMAEVEVLGRLLQHGPPRLREVDPSAPEDLDALCARATARDRKDRYGTAAELLQDLEAHLGRRGDVMSMRQIGDLLRGLFADERQKMAQLIEESLGIGGADPRSGTRAALQTALQTQAAPLLPWADGATAESRSRTFRAATGYASAIYGDPAPVGVPHAPLVETLQGAFAEPTPARREWSRSILGAAVGAAVAAVFTALVVDHLVGAQARSTTVAPGEKPQAAAIGPREVSASASPPQPPPVTSPPTESPSPSVALPSKAPSSGPPRGSTLPSRKTRSPTKPEPEPSVSAATFASASAQPPPPPSAATAPAPTPTPTGESRRSPAVSCDPPYTIDSNGIEHFKASCL